MSLIENHTFLIKQEAFRLGFSHCGIAKATQLDDDAKRLEQWLIKGYQAGMEYMERNFDLRIDPRKLVPGAQSVIVLTLNYFPEQLQQPQSPKIAKYAYGTDYHFVIKDKLNLLLQYIKENIGDVEGRGFVDSAPVLERAWAVKSGIGWVGKNGNLILRNAGSFLFIATLIVDLKLIENQPFVTNHCGTCTRCIDACPTDAIVTPTVIDANKCISYLTIELKAELIPKEFEHKMERWLFGCDICQDICPWNKFSKPHLEPGFKPIPEILNLNKEEWNEITDETFSKIFKKSPLKRAKWKGVSRNLKFISPNL